LIIYPRRRPLDVVLFLSIFGKKDLRYITEMYSFIIRIASVFRVSNLNWIDDIQSPTVKRIVSNLYEYVILPPYLKKDIPLSKDLKYAGLLSPLNLPSHPKRAEPIEGELRIGSKGNFGLDIDPPCSDCEVLVTDSLKRESIRYPGYVVYHGPKQKILELEEVCSAMSSLTVVGSRNGEDPLEYSSFIRREYEAKGLTLIIGPPKGGIMKVLGNCNNERITIKYFNFIPKQGVRDVRAEEAFSSSLSIINSILT